jgi:all-trans-retinol 13,14-reductase
MWDVIVIGTGISGLAAAGALGKLGRRVLLLEQHRIPGGQTQTFQRGPWTFATGVHYIAGAACDAHSGQRFERLMASFGHLLDWLSAGQIKFEPLANPYDIVRLPGFEFGIPYPESAYRKALLQEFPDHASEIDHWFDACNDACKKAVSLLTMHSLPPWAAFVLRLMSGTGIERLLRPTLSDELSKISNARLKAILGARWPVYGMPPDRAPFVEHAIATGAYNCGAHYPVGGPARFAETLLPLVEAAGGELRLGANVSKILFEDRRAVGVVYEQGGTRMEERAEHIIAAMSAASLVNLLDADITPDWQREVRELRPGLSYLLLFIGFEGDIAGAGASSANVWVHESDDIGSIWEAPLDDDAPALFVSFQSLKDPAYAGKPTAEVLAIVDGALFAQWMNKSATSKPPEYEALKAKIEARMLAQFSRHFPRLAPMVRFHELATPVTQWRYVQAPAGAIYGIEPSVDHLAGRALRIHTPVPNLLLAGQDIFGPGIPGAFNSGIYAAAAIEPSFWRNFLLPRRQGNASGSRP